MGTSEIPEHFRRLFEIREEALKDERTPSEHIQTIIHGAIQRKNPFINPEDLFVVLGFDGFDRSAFPVGSFKTVADALAYENEKRGEEHLYSSDPESHISTQFQTYTMNGIIVFPPDITLIPSEST